MTESAGGPLDGVVVADFSRVLAGPLATMMLGDLGAEVIKIERPGAGDDTRSWGPPFAEDGSAAYYLSVNRNKRSVVLDLSDEQQRAQARDLAVSADVVVENFRAGTMERFGLEYESLRAGNPGLVYCRVSAFGPAGGRDLPGYDFIVQAASGFMSITGEAAGSPTKTGVAIVDVFTGLYATIGIVAALAERRTSGLGQFIEVNLMSSALAALVNQASAFVNAGSVPGPMGNLHPSITPYETFATATEPIALAATNERQFSDLCKALDAPHLAADPRWSSNTARVENREALVGCPLTFARVQLVGAHAALGRPHRRSRWALVRARSRRCAASRSGSRALALRHRRWACSRRVSTVWLGWSELLSTNSRSGPKWASMGLAQEL